MASLQNWYCSNKMHSKGRYSFGSIMNGSIEFAFPRTIHVFFPQNDYYYAFWLVVFIFIFIFHFIRAVIISFGREHEHIVISHFNMRITLFDEKIELIKRDLIMSSTFLTIRTKSNTLESFVAILNSIDAMNYACFSMYTIQCIPYTHLLNRIIQKRSCYNDEFDDSRNTAGAVWILGKCTFCSPAIRGSTVFIQLCLGYMVFTLFAIAVWLYCWENKNACKYLLLIHMLFSTLLLALFALFFQLFSWCTYFMQVNGFFTSFFWYFVPLNVDKPQKCTIIFFVAVVVVKRKLKLNG